MSIEQPDDWIEPSPAAVPSSLKASVGGHPLVAATLVRRGILTPEAARAFLDPSAYAAAEPTDFPDLITAVERLRQATS